MGFSREQVQVKGYLILGITFGEQYNTKEIKVKYLVINAPFSYNMIIGQFSFNWLRIDLHTLYLCMKYPVLMDEFEWFEEIKKSPRNGM